MECVGEFALKYNFMKCVGVSGGAIVRHCPRRLHVILGSLGILGIHESIRSFICRVAPEGGVGEKYKNEHTDGVSVCHFQPQSLLPTARLFLLYTLHFPLSKADLFFPSP